MPSEPLSLLILLFFVLIIVTALALWFLLTLGRGKREVESVSFFQRDKPKQKPVRPPPEVNNDEVRGARAQRRDPPGQARLEQPKVERARDEQTQSDRDKRDAFESFGRSRNDDLDF